MSFQLLLEGWHGSSIPDGGRKVIPPARSGERECSGKWFWASITCIIKKLLKQWICWQIQHLIFTLSLFFPLNISTINTLDFGRKTLKGKQARISLKPIRLVDMKYFWKVDVFCSFLHLRIKYSKTDNILNIFLLYYHHFVI